MKVETIIDRRDCLKEALASTHITIFGRGSSILLFLFVDEVDFSIGKGLLCFYDKQKLIIHDCL